MLFSVSEQGEILQYASHLVVSFMFPALIRYVSVYYKDQQMHLDERYVIAQWPPTCFDHSYGLLQGGRNKNTNIYLCRCHSTVSNHIVLVKIQFKR